MTELESIAMTGWKTFESSLVGKKGVFNEPTDMSLSFRATFQAQRLLNSSSKFLLMATASPMLEHQPSCRSRSINIMHLFSTIRDQVLIKSSFPH